MGTEPVIPQPRDEHGQFISIGTLFERERQEHSVDHDRERQVARETAQRLEREVEETAKRLERAVEETAIRLEKAVSTALVAVADTARIHSEAHQREHLAHERIHKVEKEQVDKEESKKRDEQIRLAADLREYKVSANEWRSTVSDVTGKFVGREAFETYQKEREERLQTALDRIIQLEKSQVSEAAVSSLKDDQRRTRMGFYVAVGLLGIGFLINLLANIAQIPR